MRPMPMRWIGRATSLVTSETALRLGGTLLAAAILIGVYVAVRLTGGTPNPLVHLAYFGIIAAAVAAGPFGGATAGLLAGLLLGPWMPDSTAASATILAQWGWAVRMAVYVLAGLLVAGAWSWAGRVGRVEAARHGMREIITLVARERTSLAACRRLLAELARRRPTLAASVHVLDADGSGFLLAGWSAPEVAITHREHHTGTDAERLLQDARGDVCRRALRPELRPAFGGASLEACGARSELVVPLRVDGVPVGVLSIIGEDAPTPVTDIERLAFLELANGTASLVRRAQQEVDTTARRAADLVRPILDDPDLLRPVFQPIMSLTGGGVAGYEALARFDTEPPEPPNVWFERAASAGLSAELQALAIRRARRVAASARLPMGSFLSVNVSPGLLDDSFIRDALAGSLDGLVIELTEEEAIADYDRLRSVMAGLQRRGARFAIDDAGAGYASLRHVTELRPAFIKLDARLITGLAGDDGRQALVRAMQTFARDIGATLIAEGVETAEELSLLAGTGLPILVQGYAIAHPGPAWPTVASLPRPEETVRAAARHQRALSRPG